MPRLTRKEPTGVVQNGSPIIESNFLTGDFMMPRPLALFFAACLLNACGTVNTTPDSNTGDTTAPEGNTLPSPDASDSSDTPDPTDESDASDPTDATAPNDASDVSDTGNENDPTDETDASDPEIDPIEPSCDEDGDGYVSRECGGDDCDDYNRYTNPGQLEYCDFIDNNCDEAELVNEGIECTVYAHTSSTLYEVDPFLGTIETVSSVPGLFDFDTTVEGGLYGITSSSLYVFDETLSTWQLIGSISGMAGTSNGFAIDSTGRAFATSGSNVYEVNLVTAEFTLVGDMGSTVNSSGDCVVDKSDGLYMTSNGTGATDGDDLVQINTFTGETTTIGSTGFSSIYGLTAAWGYMFGFTGSGQLILIDTETGAGTLLYQFPGNSFYGAASSPVR